MISEVIPSRKICVLGDSDDFLIYNDSTGDLFYDPDGIGRAAAIKIAQLKAGLAITKADFYVL